MKTCSLELAKQLKEAGYPQNCCEGGYYSNYGVDEIGESDDYYHSGRVSKDDLWEREDNEIELLDYHHAWFLIRAKEQHKDLDIQLFAAPTADEILDRLPKIISVFKSEMLKNGWTVGYESESVEYTSETAYALADAAAKMWIYLKKEKLI